MSDPSRTCRFCGRATADPVETERAVFCSPGCRDADRRLDGHTDPDAAKADLATTDSGETQDEQATGAETERADFHVAGMHGATCETFLESVVRSRDGVVDAEASYVTETATVTYDPDRTDRAAIREALSVAGYTAVSREETTGEAAAAVLADPHDEATRALDDLLGFRYIAGIVFGIFLLFPYIVVFYPAQYGLLPVAFFEDGAIGGGAIPLLVTLAGTTACVVLFTGLPLLRGAYVSLWTRQPSTDLLATLTVLAAFLYSSVVLLAGRIDIYFDLAMVVAATVVAAAYYESLLKKRALRRLTDLTVARPDEARIRRSDGETETVDVEALQPGDRVLVSEGERIPVDGVLAEGRCTVDESVVTGESRPITREAGDPVVGGAVVTGNAALVEAGDPPTSSIDRLTAAVWLLQSATHGLQRRANRLAATVAPAVAAVAVLAVVGALALGRGAFAATLAGLLAVLACCPWGLALATPLSVASNLRDALARDVVVSDETVFERLRETDVVAFDKTGTLTAGTLRVVDAEAPADVLAGAALLERRASHPAADAIAAAFDPGNQSGGDAGPDPAVDGGSDTSPDDRSGPDSGDSGDARSDGDSRADTAPHSETRRSDDQSGEAVATRVTAFESHAWGVEGSVDGRAHLVGHPDLFAQRDWTLDAGIERRADRARERGRLPVVVGRDGRAEGVVVLADERRDGWERVVTGLDDTGVDVVVLTGDDAAAADAFREHPAVESVFAGVPPAGKTEVLRQLQADAHVTMVGDGTNDAPALAQADLGVALGSGTALASDAADVALVDDDLGTVETTFALARAAGRRVRHNTVLALAYNAVAVPAALAGLLNPLLAMVGAVTTVGLLVANSTRPLLSR